jgi:predicted acetyltransferase
MPSGYTIVSPGSERMDDFLAVDAWAFIFEPKEMDDAITRSVLPTDRARAVEITDAERGRVGSFVGVYSSATYGMLLPGGKVLTTSGLTWVGVHPGHRRRGLLTAMIDDHFRVSLEAGECVSTLYAMETAIYGRFGYGSSAPRYEFKANELMELPGSDDITVRFERVDRAAHPEIVAAVHARMTRPGIMAEPAPTMLAEMLDDWPSDLIQNERCILAIAEDAEGPVGFARFRRAFDMSNEGHNPQAKIEVRNFSAATPAASRRLLSTLRELDLITEVKVVAAPPDDPMLTLSKDVRALGATLLDGLWLRILDLPTALTSRTYAADVDLVLEVGDAHLPDNAGRWRFTASGGKATVSRTSDDPDVELTIQDLSAAYLGHDHIRRYAAAGLLTEKSPGALRALNAAFVTEQAPFADMWF